MLLVDNEINPLAEVSAQRHSKNGEKRMKTKVRPFALPSEPSPLSLTEDVKEKFDRVLRRRAFLKGMGMATAAVPAAVLLPAGALPKLMRQNASTGTNFRGETQLSSGF